MSDLLYRVGFASCARIGYNYGFKKTNLLTPDPADFIQPVWGQIAVQHQTRQLDAMLLLGDQVYSDYNPGIEPKKWLTPKFHAVMDTMYRTQYEKVDGFKKLFERFKSDKTQIDAIWDDHDFGYNNGSGLDKSFQKNLGSTKLLFEQFVQVLKESPNNYPATLAIPSGTPTSGIEKIASPLKLKNDVEIVLLDSRFYRSTRRGYGDELLGKPQWDALEAKLMSWNDPNKLLIICLGSPYSINIGGSNQSWAQVTYTGADHPFAHFERFTELARQKKIIFLSGDIHSNAFKDHNGFCEVISSGAHLPDDRNNPRFGLLDIYANKVDVKLYKNNAVEISKTINRATGSIQQ